MDILDVSLENLKLHSQSSNLPAFTLVCMNVWRLLQWSPEPFLILSGISPCLSSCLFLSSFSFFYFFLCSFLICFLHFWPISLFYIPSSESLLSPPPLPPVSPFLTKHFLDTYPPNGGFPGSAFQLHKAPRGLHFQLFPCIFLLSSGSAFIHFVWILHSEWPIPPQTLFGPPHPHWPTQCPDVTFLWRVVIICQFQGQFSATFS